jgi:hypothetical protein
MANGGNQRPIVNAALFVALSYVLLFIVLPIAGLAFIAYIFASVFKSIFVPAKDTTVTEEKPVVTQVGDKIVITTNPPVAGFSNFSGSEPEWTKQIPNWLICDWFYFFFIVNVVVVVTLMISIVVTAMSSSLPKTVRASQLFMMIVQMLASGTSTLFLYVLCDRSLKP